MDILAIKKLRLRFECGFSPHEIGRKEELLATLEISTCVKAAARNDDLDESVDLEKLTTTVISDFEGSNFNLIETAANRMAFLCLTFSRRIKSVKVLLEKPGANRFAQQWSITISRCLEDYPIRQLAISTGSNKNAKFNIQSAIKKIDQFFDSIEKISKYYVTKSIGKHGEIDPNKEDFINACCLITTRMDKFMAKSQLRKIEATLGRIRDPNDKFAACEIDLDITFEGKIGKDFSENAFLDVHEVKNFAHVIVPLSDVMPDLYDYQLRDTILGAAQKKTGLTNPSDYFETCEI
ncbi:uncharacterized protein LOC134844943 [Symsagittifera roscoffensis]|uniref:uncharacterized protein LOC134844943 n=1 Tax=Symsagittifera roscoffensis TaxID=84072 RepID=UPI00307B9329